MKAEKRRWMWGIVIAVSGVAALLVWASGATEDLLLAKATRVVSDKLHSYDALSDSEVLVDHQVNGMIHYFWHNRTTGAEQPLTFLDRLIRPGRHTSLELSPDGRWLLWNGGEEESITRVICMDGKRHYQLDAFWDDFNMYWMDDSRHWVEFTGRHFLATGGSELTRAIVHDVDHPNADIELKIPPGSGIMSGDQFTASGHLLVQKNYEPWDNTSFSEWPLAEYQFLPDIKLLRNWTIRLPHISTVRDMAISPAGDRIAWQLETRRASLWSALLHRLIPSFKAASPTREELWISDLDGNHWHEIGYIRLTPVDDPESPLYLGLQWMPGNRKLSFEYHTSNYTVPTD